MRELHLGSQEDRRFISGYLRLVRSITPLEMFTTRKCLSLDMLKDRYRGYIDVDLFRQIVSRTRTQIKKECSREFETIPENRYYVGFPEGDEWGGFHSKYSVGFQNMYRAGFAVGLNPKMFRSKTVRTLELVRSYLHDSVHYSTFCAYRRVASHASSSLQAKRMMPEIYREQYGINFRNPTGVSYSSPNLTLRVPNAINLNVLMDGVGVDITVSALNRLNVTNAVQVSNSRERTLLREIFLQINEDHPIEWGQAFFFEVVIPTRRFLARWGGESFRDVIFRAMLNGQLTELKTHFGNLCGDRNAWDTVFRQPAFVLNGSRDA